MENKDLQELITKAKIKNAKRLTDEEVQRITTLQYENKLGERHIESLIKANPNFITQQLDLVKTTFSEVSKSVKEEHIKTFDNIGKVIDSTSTILKTIAEKDDNSDEIKIKLIDMTEKLANKQKEILEIQEKMNKDNNNTWIKILTGVASAVALLLLGGKNINKIKN